MTEDVSCAPAPRLAEAAGANARRFKPVKWLWLTAAFFFIILILLGLGVDIGAYPRSITVFSATVALISATIVFFAIPTQVDQIHIGEIETSAAILQESIDQDFFNTLVKINFKYIDKYYLQTQIQANKAFLMSAIAGFFGMIIIAAGIVQMYRGRLEPAYVTTAAGVISEFIAAVFFYLYNKTVLRMADYHRKLVLTQNVGLALRITQDMPEADRLQAQKQLVDRLSFDVNPLLGGSEHEVWRMNMAATQAAAITAWGTMTAAMIAASAALGAALFAFLAGWLNSRVLRKGHALQAGIAQQIKHAEFRQVWINDLRTAMVEFQRLAADGSAPAETEAFGNALQILLRMNPKDPNYDALLEKVSVLIKSPGASPREDWLNAHADFVMLCQTILKTEWDVLKAELNALSYPIPAEPRRRRRRRR